MRPTSPRAALPRLAAPPRCKAPLRIAAPLLAAALLLAATLATAPAALATAPASSDALLDLMEQELARSMANLGEAADAPLYHCQYAVTEERRLVISADEGGLQATERETRRYLDVDLRVGSMALDNTHEIRGGSFRDNWTPRRLVDFPLEADPEAVRAALWNETEYQFRQALDRYMKVQANRRVKVEEEDLSADFSPAAPQRFEEDLPRAAVDAARWEAIVKRAGAYLAAQPFVNESGARLMMTESVTRMVSSEGARLKHGYRYLRIFLDCRGLATDGMELSRNESWAAHVPEHLPAEDAIMAAAQRLAGELAALADAPVVTPYIGPAILVNRASGVFFHEIFGHRLEGHRQKRESEGQTFTKMVGKEILPAFLNVYDDATLACYGGTDLRGFYRFDDEGVPARRVAVVEKGVLKEFLLTRSPIAGFPASNGHARRQVGYDTVARMGNTIVESDKAVPFPRLRELLIEEIKNQGKPYGLIFQDISGGFTSTGRRGPQAFKVQPLLVYRVYPDGRPDEVVRGVDIVGTPLTSFSKIIATGDDPGVFNGTCGAESGGVPVSAVSPSILVSEIEVEKVRKGQEKPPILPPPDSGRKEVRR
ncbi:MAG: TldD/PmbA family protein [Candidatus Krumholzibacteriota bacterium]|nr:TldD/PmbA family protein [Candidatus Krumholzibacteriota bacterium]